MHAAVTLPPCHKNAILFWRVTVLLQASPGVDIPPSASSGRRYPVAAKLALELLFWVPLFLVPIVARILAGDGNEISLKDGIATVSVSLALWVIGTHLGRWQALYRLILYPVLGAGSLIVAGVWLSKNGVLNPLTALAIIDTNRSEATEFLTGTFYGVGDVLLVSLLLVPLAALWVQFRSGLFFQRVKYATGAIVALFALQIGATDLKLIRARNQGGGPTMLWDDHVSHPIWFLKYAADRYPPLQPYYSFIPALLIRRDIAQLARVARPLAGVQPIEPLTGKPRLYVIVIGESLARHHMHLYGYPRDTTPQLDKLAEAGELLVFRHVVTSHALTVPAVLAALRFPDGRGHDQQTLFDVFNGAGFKTYWISNQYQAGIGESAISMLTASVAERSWMNQPMEGRYAERRNFDDVVLKPFETAIQSGGGDKVIFVHLLGNHFTYRARFPDSFAHFGGTGGSTCRSASQNREFNDYDDSVRFNDYVLSQIIDTTRKTDGESFVLYFSDHGEEVFDWRDFLDHDDSMLSPYLAEIPFALWLSAAYRSAHPVFTAQLRQALDRPFISSDLIDAATDLSRLTFPGMDDTRSLFSDKFTVHSRITAYRDYDAFRAQWQPDRAHAGGTALLACADMADSALRIEYIGPTLKAGL
jgi:glucan phosphoethanolaminetransferase (alkaline phosphatase superfamily)